MCAWGDPVACNAPVVLTFLKAHLNQSNEKWRGNTGIKSEKHGEKPFSVFIHQLGGEEAEELGSWMSCMILMAT